MRRLAIAAVLLLVPFASISSAGASYDPVRGGVTKIQFDKRFLASLERGGVRLVPRAPAKRRGRSLFFPVSAGHLDPGLGKGEIEQEGAFVLSSSRKSVPFRKLVVKTAAAPLVARVGGSQLKVAQGARLSSERYGFGAAIQATGLKLTKKAATRLNKKLRPAAPFVAGQPVGSIFSAPQPLVASILPVGRATLAFDSAFLDKLNDHFVSVNPVFPAERMGASFTLPIIPQGILAPAGGLGTLRTGGEIEFLQLGAGQIFLHELWSDLGQGAVLAEVDVQPSPPFPGKLGQVPVLNLGTNAVVADPKTRTIALGGAPLTLPASTAASFNEAFAGGKQDFLAGETVGSFTFVAQGQ